MDKTHKTPPRVWRAPPPPSPDACDALDAALKTGDLPLEWALDHLQTRKEPLE